MGATDTTRALRAALLGIPLFQKILLANAAASLLASGAALALIAGRSGLHAGILAAAVAGAALALPVQAVVLRLALAPLDAVEQVAEQVARGREQARVDPSPLADRRMRHLGTVMNRLLDALAVERDRLREVARRAFHAQEAERVRIAAELHEETAQSLSALLLHLRAARRATDADRRDALLDRARVEVSEAAERVRRFASALNPPALADLGLGPAVESYARGFAATGLEIEVRHDVPRDVPGPDEALALYRIVQDALSNVVRHSGARTARVEISRQGDWVEASVADDGHGFRPSEALLASPCLGLFGMRERALYAGGWADVQSTPGGGTLVRARVPARGPGSGRPLVEVTTEPAVAV
jgi:two-component system sensor histidine kinase UhpB